MEGLYEHIFGLANVMYSYNNHVQLHLTTIETQLDEIQHKLEADFQLSWQKGGEGLIVNIVNTQQSKGECI